MGCTDVCFFKLATAFTGHFQFQHFIVVHVNILYDRYLFWTNDSHCNTNSILMQICSYGMFYSLTGVSSAQITQVIGYLSEHSVLTCPHLVPEETLTEVAWLKANQPVANIQPGANVHTVAKLIVHPGGVQQQFVQDEGLRGRVRVTYNSLEITSANLDDGGLYVCSTSENGRPQEPSWRINLTIYGRSLQSSE